MTRAPVAASYALLGTLLVWSRFAGLARGYCCDEITTVVQYVREGPRTILTGTYIPNNHELFSLLGWATISAVGESEIALRVWSAVPFVIGVAVVTAWLHVRVGALCGILFLFFATLSPLLLDISWQARGYGLAFLAMGVLTVAALEIERCPRVWLVAVFCAAGVVGTLTLPHFVLAFGATAAVVVALPETRLASLVGVAISLAVVAVWYLPHLNDIAANTAQDYGAPVRTEWLLTAPFDHIVVPALTALDEQVVLPSRLSPVWTLALVALMASSPLLRRRVPALVLCAGTMLSLLAFWLAEAELVPRFFSFLLVPLFILLASGSAETLGRFPRRPAPVRTLIALTTVSVAVVASASAVTSVPREAREAQDEAANLIRTETSSSTPVHARMPYPNDLAFHLGRRVNGIETRAALAAVCTQPVPIVYVDEPWLSASPDVPCLRRPGTHHVRLEQYARGGVIDVWFLPASTG